MIKWPDGAPVDGLPDLGPDGLPVLDSNGINNLTWLVTGCHTCPFMNGSCGHFDMNPEEQSVVKASWTGHRPPEGCPLRSHGYTVRLATGAHRR
jgi:hypothetical protein